MASPSSSLTETFRGICRAVLDLLYPPACLLCKKELERQGLCPDCTTSFEPVTPPKCTLCGTPFLEAGEIDHPCGHCIKEPPPFHHSASSYRFSNTLVDAIHALKYSGKSALAKSLGSLMASHDIFEEDHHLIVPVPLHIHRLRDRGFNQSLLLAKPISKEHGIAIDPFLLTRIRETPSQTGMMGRKAREQNVKGAFALRNIENLKGAKILLVDDVYTTGATVKECSKMLKKGGAVKVNVLTLGRVPEPGS